MPVIETVLIYGAIPLAVFLILAALTLLPGRGKEKTKYRPGQPWTAETWWWEPPPDARGVAGGHGEEDHADGHRAPSLGATAAALAIGEGPADQQPSEGPRGSPAGGARGTW